jgi:hypothetical protein
LFVPFVDDGASVVPLIDEGATVVPLTEDGAIVVALRDDGAIVVPLTEDGEIVVPLTDDGGMVVLFSNKAEGANVVPLRPEGESEVLLTLVGISVLVVPLSVVGAAVEVVPFRMDGEIDPPGFCEAGDREALEAGEGDMLPTTKVGLCTLGPIVEFDNGTVVGACKPTEVGTKELNPVGPFVPLFWEEPPPPNVGTNVPFEFGLKLGADDAFDPAMEGPRVAFKVGPCVPFELGALLPKRVGTIVLAIDGILVLPGMSDVLFCTEGRSEPGGSEGAPRDGEGALDPSDGVGEEVISRVELGAEVAEIFVGADVLDGDVVEDDGDLVGTVKDGVPVPFD